MIEAAAPLAVERGALLGSEYRLPLALRYLIDAQVERLRDGDLVPHFLRFAIGLAARRAHQELPGGDRRQLHAQRVRDNFDTAGALGLLRVLRECCDRLNGWREQQGR